MEQRPCRREACRHAHTAPFRLPPPHAGLISNVVSLPRVVPDPWGGTVILAEMGSNVLVRWGAGAHAMLP